MNALYHKPSLICSSLNVISVYDAVSNAHVFSTAPMLSDRWCLINEESIPPSPSPSTPLSELGAKGGLWEMLMDKFLNQVRAYVDYFSAVLTALEIAFLTTQVFKVKKKRLIIYS